jgi:HK97 family phage major capsid protein
MTKHIEIGRFESVGDCILAEIRYRESEGKDFDPRLVLEATATGLNECFLSEGMSLVPLEQNSEIWEKVNDDPIVRRCGRQPITTKTGALTLPAVSEQSRANGSRYGGLRLDWMDEAEGFPETMPKWAGLRFTPKKIGGVVHLTSELWQDAPALAAWFTRVASVEVGMMIADSVVNGSGVGRPLGILSSDAVIEVAPESGHLLADQCRRIPAAGRPNQRRRRRVGLIR